MNTNLAKFPALISEDLEALLEACKYTLFRDGMLYRDYRNGNKRLVFNGTAISYMRVRNYHEDDRGLHWHTAFRCEINDSLDTIVIMDILNGIGAINYWQLPEARQMIRDIQNQIRKTQLVAND